MSGKDKLRPYRSFVFVNIYKTIISCGFNIIIYNYYIVI